MERLSFRRAELGVECGSAALGILTWIGNTVVATGRLQLGVFLGGGGVLDSSEKLRLFHSPHGVKGKLKLGLQSKG